MVYLLYVKYQTVVSNRNNSLYTDNIHLTAYRNFAHPIRLLSGELLFGIGAQQYQSYREEYSRGFYQDTTTLKISCSRLSFRASLNPVTHCDKFCEPSAPCLFKLETQLNRHFW